jgi:4-amino-4-deoxychorismate lyase
MSQLLETIKLENGRLVNLKYHNARFNKARKELFSLPEEDLAELVQIPATCLTGVFRCRIVYQHVIEKVEFIPDQPREIHSLKVVENNTIEYPYKYANRNTLQELYCQRGDADEVIIIKNGLVTDCSIGNLVFFDGKKWLTPDQPLLHGTQRENLLEQGKISEARISEKSLSKFSLAGIINTFYSLENMPCIKKEQILY